MKFNWNYPTTIWVGKNRSDELSEACENLKIKITDSNIKFL